MDVNDFMSKLAANSGSAMAKNRNNQQNRVIEKISLNFEGNFGRYQVLPINDVVTDFPYVVLRGTREICIPRKSVQPDGSEQTYSSWIKILPKSAYLMKDMTGRTTSSLTAEDERLLNEATTLFDQLFDEVDARNNMPLVKDLLRKRNYTIFHAMCLNKWDFVNNRNAVKSNFCGLFVTTASGFITAVEDSIKERTLLNGNDSSWLDTAYSEDLSKRDGFMLFSIARSTTTPGYQVSVSHETGRANLLMGVNLPTEELELMKSPIATFLGWQASHQDDEKPVAERRLFNANIIKEAISFMTEQLASIRLAKQNGATLADAVKITTEAAIANAKVPTKTTNDPMLAGNANNGGVNPERIAENNQHPFSTPPVGHMDPVTGAPVGSTQPANGPAPAFQAPNFAAFGQGAPKSDLPF